MFQMKKTPGGITDTDRSHWSQAVLGSSPGSAALQMPDLDQVRQHPQLGHGNNHTDLSKVVGGDGSKVLELP